MEPIRDDVKPVDALGIEVAPEDIHIVGSGVLGIRVDPVLGRRVLVPEQGNRHAGDGILRRGDAVAFGGLLGEKSNGLGVADPRRAIAIKFNVVGPPGPLVSDVPRGKDGFCTSERMADDGDAVVGFFIVETDEEFYDGFADASP